MEKPSWWPQPTNQEWVARVRSDYPERTQNMTDKQVIDSYAYGCKYDDLWDHLSDARYEYEKLCDAFLQLVEETGKKPSDFITQVKED